MNGFWNWLGNHEAYGVWLEAIALVAIFAWDRIDAYWSHKQTVAQIKLTQDQITLSQNAERAWLLTELAWGTGNLKVALGTSKERDKPTVEHTTVTVMLTCRNEGRSPAFVDKIAGYVEIVDSVRNLTPLANHKMAEVTPLGPIAPNKSGARSLQFSCTGQVTNEQLLSIFVTVEYRDIFEQRRYTNCGYTVTDFNLYRQDGLPERNKFT